MLNPIKNQHGTMLQYLAVSLVILIISGFFAIKLFLLDQLVGAILIAVLFALPNLLMIIFGLPLIIMSSKKSDGTNSEDKKDE